MLPARLDRGGGLVGGQRVLRRRCCRCRGAPCARRSARRQRLGVDREVDDPHGRAGDLGQHVDRRAAGVEVGDHLRGDLRRVGGHPGPGDAVVTGEHHHPRALELPRRALALARRDPHRQVLEPAQRAGRLGQRVLAGAGGRGGAPHRAATIGGKSITRHRAA